MLKSLHLSAMQSQLFTVSCQCELFFELHKAQYEK